MYQWAKSCGFCMESPGMADTCWRGIHGEIWVVSETRIRVEIEGKIRGKFKGYRSISHFSLFYDMIYDII